MFKNGSNAVVLSDLKPDDRNYKYSIQPGLDSAKGVNVKNYFFNQDFSLPFVKKKGNLIQFQNQTLLLLDSNNINSVDTFKADYVFISQNNALGGLERIKSSLLVINSDNSNRYTDTVVKYLSNNNRKYYTLKRNKALNLPSN